MQLLWEEELFQSAKSYSSTAERLSLMQWQTASHTITDRLSCSDGLSLVQWQTVSYIMEERLPRLQRDAVTATEKRDARWTPTDVAGTDA